MLVHAIHELGVEPKFWMPASTKTPTPPTPPPSLPSVTTEVAA
jgi:hypothetical protein